jgi:hypothetical protein
VKRGKREGALPAVAAISAVSAIPTTATTTPPATIPAASATVSAATAATSAATRAFRLRARLVDNKVPAAKVLTVQAGDRTIRFFIVGDLDESEAARLTGETVANQADGRGADSQLSKPLLQLFFRCIERKIADVKLLHLRTPSARNLKKRVAERTEET